MGDRIRVMIVDDEPLARERLRTLLETEDDIDLVGECNDGRAAIEMIDNEKPDLVFLDVQMPELDGFDVLNAVEPENRPGVIFVTAYDEYAVRAFEVHAVDYVLKPFDRERFQAALERGRGELGKNRRAGSDLDRRLEALLEELENRRKRLERIVVKSGGRVFFLRTEDVDWIEAAGNYVELHVGNDSHLLRETMNSLVHRLDPRLFLRIHRRVIVNVERIQQLEGVTHGEYVIVLKDGTRLGSSRGYREGVQRLLEAGT